jgi:hypothetical protein
VAADSVQIAVSETGTASGAGKRGPAAGSMRGPIVPIVRSDTRPISRRRTRFSSSDTPRNSEGRLRCAHANAIRLHCAIRLRATDDDRRSDHRRRALCSRRMTFTRRALPRVGSRGVGTVAHYRQHPSAAAHCSPKKHSYDGAARIEDVGAPPRMLAAPCVRTAALSTLFFAGDAHPHDQRALSPCTLSYVGITPPAGDAAAAGSVLSMARSARVVSPEHAQTGQAEHCSGRVATSTSANGPWQARIIFAAYEGAC